MSTEHKNKDSNTEIKILILEDNDLDAQLIEQILKTESISYTMLKVDTEESFRKALADYHAHIILSDFRLPAYDGFAALEEVRRSDTHIPFVFVSGAIGEDLAIEALKRGATDCVNKSHLNKLPGVINRAMEEAKQKHLRIKAEEAIEHLQYRNSLILDFAGEGILGLDNDLRFISANRSARYLLKYETDEIVGADFSLILNSPEEITNVSDTIKSWKSSDVTVNSIALKIKTKSGTSLPAECTINPILEGNVITGYVFTIIDITERIRSQDEIEKGYVRLRKILFESIHAMSMAIELRDPYTAGHQKRVTSLAVAIAHKLELTEDQYDGIYLAAMVHDIGKISVPAEILSRPSKLTDTEFAIIKEHSLSGFQILKDVDFFWPIAEIVYQHHERIDGKGYPRGLVADQILLESKIIAVADVVEAMASHRPYRPSLGLNKALDEIRKNSDIIYDLAVSQACLSLFEKDKFVLQAS